MGRIMDYNDSEYDSPECFLAAVNENAPRYEADCCYCIVEGPTDVSFYSLYLKPFYKNIKVIPVKNNNGKMNCDQVKEHLDYYNTNLIGNKYHFLFFIDRDFGSYKTELNPNIPLNYDSSSLDNITNPENLYLTDYYSIENSIFTKETIIKLFEGDFKEITYFDKNDNKEKIYKKSDKTDVINKIANLFEYDLKQYELKLVKIIAILIWCKTNNIDYCCQKVKFTDFIKIKDTGEIVFQYKNDDNMVVCEGDPNYNEDLLQSKLKEKLYSKSSSIDETKINYDEVSVIENDIKSEKIYHIFRGHFIEPFWNKFNTCFKKIINHSDTLTIVNELKMNTVYANCGHIDSLTNFALRTICKFKQEQKTET